MPPMNAGLEQAGDRNSEGGRTRAIPRPDRSPTVPASRAASFSGLDGDFLGRARLLPSCSDRDGIRESRRAGTRPPKKNETAPPVMPLPFVLCPLLFALCSLLFALVIDYRGCSRENSGNPTAPRHRLDRSSGPASLDSRLSDPPRRRKDDPMPCRVPPRAGHCRWAVLAL